MSGRGELLVGVDVGTTMTKAAIVTADGEEVAWGSVPTPWYPVPTGAEMGAVGHPRRRGASNRLGPRRRPSRPSGRLGRDEHGRNNGVAR